MAKTNQSRPPSLRAMVETKALKVGHFLVEFATPGIARILKAAGCEFVVLDMEHSGFGFETVRSVAQSTRGAELPLIVRVPSKSYHHIARALDMGAQGIMLPMVSSAEEAREIVQCVKYPPQGQRGALFQFAHDDYVPGDPKKTMRDANRATTVFAQIETQQGVDNVDAIAAVAGIDALWIGQFDLSNSLGIPGQFEHPLFTDASKSVVRAARKHGISAARLAPKVSDCISLYKDGFDFISYSGDVWAYFDAVSDAVDEIRQGCQSLSARRASAERKAGKKSQSPVRKIGGRSQGSQSKKIT